MNKNPQHKVNNPKNNQNPLLKWINAVIAFGVTLFLMLYLTFIVFDLSISKIAYLIEQYPFLARYGLYLAIIPNLIVLMAIFAIAAIVAAPFLPKDNVELISSKISEFWNRVSHTASSIGIALGIFSALLLLYLFFHWVFVVPAP